MGVSSFWMGELARSRLHLEQALGHYDIAQHGVHVALYSQDPTGDLPGPAWALDVVLGLSRSWRPREVERGPGTCRDAWATPTARAYALTFGGLAAIDRRGFHLASEQPCSDGGAGGEGGVGVRLSSFRIFLEGWALTEEGEARAGHRAHEEGSGGPMATPETAVLFPYFMALLACGLRETGAIDAGLAAISEAQQMARDEPRITSGMPSCFGCGGSCCWRSPGNEEEAEDCFREALEVARRQGARSLELRAATSLARHRGDEESLRLLKELYGWFSEGFDTADLQEARAVLEA